MIIKYINGIFFKSSSMDLIAIKDWRGDLVDRTLAARA